MGPGWDGTRHDPFLVDKLLDYGLEAAGGAWAELALVEVPDGCQYDIDEYDGLESLGETWITVTPEELAAGLSPERLELARRVTCIRLG